MSALEAALAAIHVAVAAVWLGAMVYSLAVVQPRAARVLGSAERYEELAAELAAGARWKVLAMCATLGASGGGLVAVELAEADDPSAAWVALVAAKGGLLAVAVALFAHVSWRLWPARLFAPPAELAAVQRHFRRVAVALTAVVAAALVLGSVADAVG